MKVSVELHESIIVESPRAVEMEIETARRLKHVAASNPTIPVRLETVLVVQVPP
jgi:hypothetical protein